jgi:bacteriocin biosynthesis cyclodehydratase domain-containing protein
VTPLHEHRSPATSNDRVGSSASPPAEGAELQVLLAQLRDPNLRFPARPALVPDLDVFEMPDGLGFQFRGGETPVILRGRTVAPVVEFLEETLDGATTLDTLLHACPPEIGVVTLVRSLLLLHGKGLLTDGAAEPAAPSSAVAGDETHRRQLLYWGRHLDLTRSASSSGEIQRRLSTAEVVVVGTGIFGSVTADLLARSGCARLRLLAWDDDGFLQEAMAGAPSPPLDVVRLETTAVDSALDTLRAWIDDADLLVTATCDAPNALFRGINNLSLQRRRPWLHGNTDGSTIDLGPLVQPFESACYACLELRTRSAEGFAIENELYQARLAAERESGTRNVIGEAVWPATLAASILVGEACRVLSGLAPATLVDSVLRLTPLTGIVEQNQVTRVPRCPECYRGAIPAHGVDAPMPLLGIEAATP